MPMRLDMFVKLVSIEHYNIIRWY